jgi:hypothetical protein
MTRKQFEKIVKRLEVLSFNAYEKSLDNYEKNKVNKAYNNWDKVYLFAEKHGVKVYS